jgi:DNA-binding response OmpR family regulator
MKHKLSILVVEDNVMMQETLSELLTQDGHRVSIIDCGDALGELGCDNVDVVILDVNLPGEDGFSIAKRLRARFPRLGIIMLTACNRPEDSITGYVHGVDNYFHKPFQAQVLLAAIQNLGQRVLASQKSSLPSLNLRLDYLKKNLLFAEERESIALTPIESLILRNLILAENHTLEDWQLQELIETEIGEEITRHYLQVIMSRLRKKIEAVVPSADSIKNIRGIGYRLFVDITIV